MLKSVMYGKAFTHYCKGKLFMDNRVLHNLKDHIKGRGESICHEKKILEGLLLDLFSGHDQELNILLLSARINIPSRMISKKEDVGVSQLIALFVDELVTKYSIREHEATWAIQAWAYVIDLTTQTPKETDTSSDQGVAEKPEQKHRALLIAGFIILILISFAYSDQKIEGVQAEYELALKNLEDNDEPERLLEELKSIKSDLNEKNKAILTLNMELSTRDNAIKKLEQAVIQKSSVEESVLQNQFQELEERYSRAIENNRFQASQLVAKLTEISQLNQKYKNLEESYYQTKYTLETELGRLKSEMAGYEIQVRDLKIVNEQLTNTLVKKENEQNQAQLLPKTSDSTELLKKATARITVNRCRERLTNNLKCVKSISIRFTSIAAIDSRVSVLITSPDFSTLSKAYYSVKNNTLSLDVSVDNNTLIKGVYKVTLLSNSNETLLVESFKV